MVAGRAWVDTVKSRLPVNSRSPLAGDAFCLEAEAKAKAKAKAKA